MNRPLSFMLTGAMLLFASPALSQAPDSLFAGAADAYRDGRYDAAIQLYDSIISLGRVSAPVYYNLGNARFRSGDLSGAILAYERALRLDPTDEDIRHNLKLAYLRTQDRIDPLPELFLITWVRRLNATLPVTVTVPVFTAAWISLFGALILLYLVRVPGMIRLSRAAFFLSSGVGALFGLLLLLQVLVVPETREGIVRAPTVTSKSSPDAQGTDAFVIHEGLKVSMGDSVGGWVRITLADGKTGWIREEAVEAI